MLRIVTRTAEVDEVTEQEQWLQERYADLLRILQDEKDIFDLTSSIRQGLTVLLKIRNYYNDQGLVDNDYAPSDNIMDFVPMMEAKLQYITTFIHDDNDYSLYKLPPSRLKGHYISNAFLPMRLGPHDTATEQKYRRLVAEIYG